MTGKNKFETLVQTEPRESTAKFPIVAVGASAGGLEAFEHLFAAMPADSGIAFVLIAHLDPTHISLLPELIQKSTKMPVEQIQDGTAVQSDHVYVIPPNKNLTILNGTLQLLDLPLPRGGNLPIDSFFRALAEDQGANAGCIILSGTGTDGTLGLKAIKGAAGLVMVQDEASAKFDGMPRSAFSTGLADYVLPPEQMPEKLLIYFRHGFARSAAFQVPADGSMPSALQKICVILRAQTGHDFSQYKKNSICRRIERRMNVHQIEKIEDYVRYLQDSEREVSVLFKELLIGVTRFFRDPEAFDELRDDLLPKMLKQKPEDYTVRVWVAGCSSGEEAYSLGIILQECMEAMGRHFNVQIFGTDLDDEAIRLARAGVYPESIAVDVSPDRLQRWFIKEEDGQYRIKKSIREMLVFAPQSITKDPPFTRLDLLSCRNLLIYLDPELQQKVMPVFHYSLKPDGILFLGPSETVGIARELFSVLDKKWKLFSRRGSDEISRPVMRFPSAAVADPTTIRNAEELSAIQLVETILQQSNTPPCAMIDDANNIVYIHGRTGRFLEPAEGKANLNILEMARPGLKAELAAAIHKAAMHKQEVVLRGLRIGVGESILTLDLTVTPVLEQTALRGLMMVVFKEIARPVKTKQSNLAAGKSRSKAVEVLEQELQYTRENLQTTIEELETANEELQSTNEELQSTNEEMETSKEELQSLNEEASTVNVELQVRIDELSKTNDDMKNLLDSTEIAALFLDTELRIRRFTPKATAIIPLAGVDSGRPIQHFATSLIGVELAEYGNLVLADLAVREAEVTSKDGHVYVMKVRPYRTVNNVIDGVVITFEDIVDRKRAEAKLRESEAFLHTLMQTALDGVLILNPQGDITEANPVFCQLIGYSRADLLKRALADLIDVEAPATNEQHIRRLIDREYDRFESRQRCKDGSFIDVEVSSAYSGEQNKRIVVFVRKITGQCNR
jgi:two-component system CheB/CheR fusion protein